jgi:C-terminal processing protease CtpA/Prc
MNVADSSGAQKLVVDLRFNGGGNSTVIRPLVQALKSRRAIKVYTLVGRYTFSSGFMAALDLQKQNGAVLVGEAMGQRPNTYGDIRPLKLPNSGLTAWYCTKYFRLVADSDPPSIQPDVTVVLSASDYFAGRDAVMDYVLSH